MGSPPAVGAPARPDVPADARRSSRGGGATIAAVATILAVVLGGYVVAEALSEPVGRSVVVAGIVSVRPLSGWVSADGGSSVGVGPSVLLTRGSANLLVSVRETRGERPGTLAGRYVDELLSERLSQLSVSSRLETVRLRSGVPGVRFAYIGVVGDTGTSVEGEVTVVVTASGQGIAFDAWAPAGLLPFVLSDVRAMVAEADVS